ncbi:Annexin, partial [Lojkania enalia]
TYGPPPGQQGWNQYPQQQPYPPQPYGAPPQQTWGNQPPPMAQPYGQPPPQQQFGAPGQAPPMGPPTQPSLGYGPMQTAQIDVSADVEGLHKAMKGFGTNEKELIRILAKKDPIQVNTIRTSYNQRLMKDLIRDLEKETSGYFEKGLVAIARGPLANDAYTLYDAIKGAGTDEQVIDDVLIARSNADINAIKAEYANIFKKTLESDLRGDLSMGTQDMYMLIISARRNEDSIGVFAQQVDQDVTALQDALGSLIGKNSSRVCEVLLTKNDAQVRAICSAYSQRYGKTLDKVIKSKFSGHMEKALCLFIERANNRAVSDAIQLEDAMAGMGTKDKLLVQRVVRAHWDRQHMQQVRTEFQKKYGKDLVARIKGETSRYYEDLMVACV